MAEIKREIRTLGQRVSGLTAGNTYTFVLKRPNVRVDVVNAMRSVELAQEQMTALGKLAGDLEHIRAEAELGNGASARAKFNAVKGLVRSCGNLLSDAKEFAVRAAEDAKDAHADVKDAYNAAKDGAENAVEAGETLFGGVDDIMKALGSMVVEAEISETASASAADTPAHESA